MNNDFRQFGISDFSKTEIEIWQENPESSDGKDCIFLNKKQIKFFVEQLFSCSGSKIYSEEYEVSCVANGYNLCIVVDSIESALSLKEEFNCILGLELEIESVTKKS